MVLVVGVWAATAVYVKNRTDRHNAAVDRGEIRSRRRSSPRAGAGRRRSRPRCVDRLGELGYPADDIGQVTRFDGGCIVKRRNRRDVSVVVGDDGGVAYFDPRWVDDLRAASEYRAGRGREPTALPDRLRSRLGPACARDGSRRCCARCSGSGAASCGGCATRCSFPMTVWRR